MRARSSEIEDKDPNLQQFEFACCFGTAQRTPPRCSLSPPCHPNAAALKKCQQYFLALKRGVFLGSCSSFALIFTEEKKNIFVGYSGV